MKSISVAIRLSLYDYNCLKEELCLIGKRYVHVELVFKILQLSLYLLHE